MIRPYHPPFQLTHRMTEAMIGIAELLGAWKAVNPGALRPELRRGNRIRSIQASLAVEQNTLTLEQVTAVLEGKVVLGSPREIQEVRNAFAAYDWSRFDLYPSLDSDLLQRPEGLLAAPEEQARDGQADERHQRDAVTDTGLIREDVIGDG